MKNLVAESLIQTANKIFQSKASMGQRSWLNENLGTEFLAESYMKASLKKILRNSLKKGTQNKIIITILLTFFSFTFTYYNDKSTDCISTHYDTIVNTKCNIN